jgi:hypothetical protein
VYTGGSTRKSIITISIFDGSTSSASVREPLPLLSQAVLFHISTKFVSIYTKRLDHQAIGNGRVRFIKACVPENASSAEPAF